jgi:ribokinase
MIDIFTPNESECEIITGISVNSIDDAKRAVEFLNNKGIPQVIITLGGNGVVYNNDKAILHKAVPKVTVVDTTAAGDSFTGAIALALSQGKNIDEAVDFGNIVGTLTVTKKGAQTSLPTMEDVDYYIKNKNVGGKHE